MVSKEIENILLALNFIKEDEGVPRNIRSKINETICCLNENKEFSLKIDKILQDLDEISTDPNLPIYTRVEILNMIGLLGGYQ
ncbi:MAG: UPF0147 family protein [Nanoarchaeota archaeon]